MGYELKAALYLIVWVTSLTFLLFSLVDMFSHHG